jgi:hypothetical protein
MSTPMPRAGHVDALLLALVARVHGYPIIERLGASSEDVCDMPDRDRLLSIDA